MSGVLKNQRLLLNLLKVAARPFSRNFPYIYNPSLSRAFAAAIPRRAPSGFSVSFAPEPEEPEPEPKTPALRKSSAKEAKSKRKLGKEARSKEDTANKAKSKKKAAKKAEPPREQENTPVYERKETSDHASAVAIPDHSPTSPQKQGKHTHTKPGENNVTRDSSATDSDHDKAVELGFENEIFLAEELTTESSKPDEYHRGALAPKEHTKTTSDDCTTAAEEEKKPEEARRKRATVGTGFIPDKIPIKPQLVVESAPTVTQSLFKTAKREKHGSRDPSPRFTGPTTPSAVPKWTSKRSNVDPKSKADIQIKPARPPPSKKEPWQVQKQALKNKFGSEGWNPRKKLSPDTIDGIRALHEQYPDKYPTQVLAEKFKVSAEAVRRILKSKWRADPEKQAERRERWARRHDRIWDQQAAIGLRPARTKVKKPLEPGEVDENADIEEFHLARARKQARDTHLTNES